MGIIMKKIVMLLICFLILSGFTVKNNILIENRTIKENIEFLITKTEIEECKKNIECDSFVLLLINNEQSYFFKNDYSKYYKKEKSEDETNVKITLSATYYSDEFKDSVFAHTCFENFEYTNDKNNWIFSLDGRFSCIEADEININVTTDYNIVEHNADYQDQNKLVWNFSKKTTDKSIYLNLDKKFKILSSNNSSFMFILIIIIAAVAFLLIKKYKKNNEKW